ncbi:hypothetical protein EZV62_010937 [Acer yangbiense]|uniref:Uncharacterized protein n=1 Tax=Acer yangbiense TaxID=1000413 RepID=A0A5C7I343_9ROSI|nr:hypothetical protein EZV62_010937 [Acer yangbiense]
MASGSGSGGDGSRNVNRGKGHVENLLQNIGDAVIADDVTFQQFIEDRFGSNQPSTPNPEFDGLNPAYNTPNINENVSNPPPPSDDFFAETPCAKPQEKEKSIVPELPVGKPLAADEPSEVLQKVQLESIASSSEIRDALKDESLQKLILEIDGSPDAENALDKAMELEVFRIFTDKILSAVGP